LEVVLNSKCEQIVLGRYSPIVLRLRIRNKKSEVNTSKPNFAVSFVLSKREQADKISEEAQPAGQGNGMKTLYRTREMSGGTKIPTD